MSPLTPDPRPHSNPSTVDKKLEYLTISTPAPQTASLEFAEFSYINDQGIIQRTDTDNVEALAQYLWEAYKVIDLIERLPYLILVCKDKVPEPSEQPFLVAGLVGIWLIEGGNPAPDDTDLGEMPIHFSNFKRSF
jgi:hypothetical protein